MAKKAPKERVRCIECQFAQLFQRDNNPVIAKCPYLLYRQVANSWRLCQIFVKAVSPKQITKF